MLRALLLAAAAIGLAPHLSAAVLVVDMLGGAPYTSIQAAVIAAADGDVVLVKAGTYGPVEVVNKGVSIVADAGAFVEIEGGVHVKDTLIPHRVLLRGIIGRGVHQQPGALPEGLRLTIARGPVRVEECSFFGADGVQYTPESAGAPGARADIALDLSLTRCFLAGGDGDEAYTGGPFSAGGPGMWVAAATVALHDCLLVGGTTVDADDLGDGAPGGSGIWVTETGAAATLPTTLFAAGAKFIGQDGSIDQLCFTAGDGGDGAHLEGALVAAWFLDCDFSPGVKGTCGNFGTDGVDIDTVNGATGVKLPGLSRELTATSPVREAQALALQVDAAPADLCFLLVTLGGLWQLDLATSGVLLTAPPYVGGLVPIGTAPASGTYGLGLPVPALPAGVDHVIVHLQGVFADTAGGWWLGGPATPVLLDAAF